MELEQIKTLKVTEPLHYRLRQVALARKVKLNALVEELLAAAANGPTEATPAIPDSLSPEDAAAVRSFIELLREGHQTDKQLARMVVESWNARKTPIPANRRAVAESPSQHQKQKRSSDG